VHAGKPDLAKVLVFTGLSPEVIPVKATPLVDRDRLSADEDAGIVRRVRQLDGIVDPAQGTDCIPTPMKSMATSREKVPLNPSAT
jgi:hypothetical protein